MFKNSANGVLYMGNEEYLGKDVKLVNGDVVINDNNDLDIVNYKENMKQAIVNRLRTHKGWFNIHPYYGSLMYTYIGQRLSKKNVNGIKVCIYDALRQDPRIEEIKKVNIIRKENTLYVEIEVKLIEENGYLNIVSPLENIIGV